MAYSRSERETTINESYEKYFAQNGSVPVESRVLASPFCVYEFYSKKGRGRTLLYEIGSYATISYSDDIYYCDFEYIASSCESVIIHQYDSILSDCSFPLGRVHAGLQYIEQISEHGPQRYVIKKDVPAKVFGIELYPEYYDFYLKKECGIRYTEFEQMLRCNQREICIPELSSVFHQMLAFKGNRISAELFFRAKLNEALSLLFKNAGHTNRRTSVTAEDYRAILKITDYMVHNTDNALVLNDMAERACMSPSKFKYTFQAVTGHSFSAHFFLLRMTKACDLLLHSNDYIATIAQRVGYKNSGSFSEQFRRYAGILPSEYRAANQNTLME